MNNEKNKEYVLVDKVGLLSAICDTAWASEVKQVDATMLYHLSVDETGQVVNKEVKAEWADVYHNLYSAYEALLTSYIREEQESK